MISLDLPSVRILIVEDEASHAEAMARSLAEMDGANIRVMTSLREYQRDARAWSPALLLLDFFLPDGRATEILPDPAEERPYPVVVVTSNGNEQIAVEAMKCGAFDYLVKSPETFAALPRTLPRLLREWQQMREGKRIRRELEASEARQAAMIAHISDVIAIIGADGVTTYQSPNLERIFGWQPAELVGRWFWSMIHTDDLPQILQHFSHVTTRQEASFSDRCRFQCQDGTFKWIHCYAVNLMETPHIAGILLNYHDITKRVEAEQALQASRELFAKAFHTNPDAIAINRLSDGVYIAINEGFTRITGYTEADVLGESSLSERCPVWDDPEDQARLLDCLHASREVVGLEATFRTKDGACITGLMSARLIEIEGDTAVLSITRDITELRRTEQQRRQLESQLWQAQKMECLGVLAGGVAHDINNVLAAILGLASAHLELSPPGSAGHRAFDTIAQAALRGGDMVKGLLRFARRSPAEEQDLDLNTILRDESALLAHTTLARIQVSLDLAEDLHTMRGDPSALHHAIMNLCVNALDAMPEQGTLVLRSRNLDQDWIEVQVADTGQGMPEAILAKAMDPFFTTKAPGQGTGLGLSMVYSTVKAHHGDMEIRSTPGKGTQVYLRFPACTPTSQPLGFSQNEPLPHTRPLDVLVVDDDDLVLGSTLAVLETLGHRGITAPSGEAALTLLETGSQPDVVILDLNMPGLGGADTLPRVRTLAPHLPVLIVTGRADEAAIQLSEAFPHVHLLPKPFTKAELGQQLDKLCAVT